MKELAYDIAAESGVISTLLQHPEFILHSEYLKPGYFYKKENGCIYWAIQELYKAGIDKIDTFNLTTQINSNKGVKNIIDSLNIPSIQEFIDLSKNIARDTTEEYIKITNIVVTLSYKRDLYKKILNYENMCLDEKQDNLNVLNTYIYDDLNKLAEQYVVTENIKLFGDEIDNLWDQICKRRSTNGVYGIPSKYSLLNEYFTYESSELILFQARMKRGKSAFMMNEALHKIKNSIPTAYLDSEMSSRLFLERVLSHLTKIPIKKIKIGDYSASEEKIINDTKAWLKKQPFVHIYDPGWTNDKIYTTCQILKYKMNLGFVVFDYIKSNTMSSSEQYNELGEKCDFLKNRIAGTLDIPVLCGAQLNRNNQTADSDKLERYCTVSIIWREKTSEEIMTDGKECGNYALNVKLNRIGEQMMDDEYVDFLFNGNVMSIEQASKQHEKVEPFS
jgi:replicative DNA helicase